MAAASTDYLTHVGSPGTATTLSAPGHTIAGTALTVASTTNWPTDTGAIFAIDTVTLVDGVETRDAGSYTEWEGVVASSTSITGLVLRTGTDQNYPAGSTTRVYIPVSSARENRLVDGLLVSHNQNGTMITALPLTSPVLTTPKIVTSINDANGNEVIKTPATSSAVNELTVTNAATGNNPTLSATGGDTNIHLSLTGKGTGGVLTKNPYKFNVYWNAGAGAYLSVGGTSYIIKFDTEEYDTGSNFDTSTWLFTAPINGFYHFDSAVSINTGTGAASAIDTRLVKNASTLLSVNQAPATTVAPNDSSLISKTVQLVAGDTVKVTAACSTGGIGVNGGLYLTYFSGYLVSAT